MNARLQYEVRRPRRQRRPPWKWVLAAGLGFALMALAFAAGRRSVTEPGPTHPLSGPLIAVDAGGVQLLPDASLTIDPLRPPAPMSP